jgi:hypothetical protein
MAASRCLSALLTIAVEPPTPVCDVVDLIYKPPVIELDHSITVWRAYEVVIHLSEVQGELCKPS